MAIAAPPFTNPASILLWNFLKFLDGIYGMYSDSCAGIDLFAQNIKALPAPPDKAIFFLHGDDPNSSDATYNHAVKIGDLISRNAHDGPNQLLLSRSCIVFIYSIWETVRPLYAEAISRVQNDIVSDVFGDLRNYRNAIAHNNSVLGKKPIILPFVKMGEPVELKRAQMDELFVILFNEVDQISVKFTGDALKLPFARILNPGL